MPLQPSPQCALALSLRIRAQSDKYEIHSVGLPKASWELDCEIHDGHEKYQSAGFYDPEREHLHVLALDTRYQIKAIHLVSIGSLNESVAHPREIFRPLIAIAAYAFVLVHNHPSGDPNPGEADRRLTVRLQEASRLLQIHLLDHLIIGETHFSFREAGLL